jgi:hypothetical protein
MASSPVRAGCCLRASPASCLQGDESGAFGLGAEGKDNAKRADRWNPTTLQP